MSFVDEFSQLHTLSLMGTSVHVSIRAVNHVAAGQCIKSCQYWSRALVNFYIKCNCGMFVRAKWTDWRPGTGFFSNIKLSSFGEPVPTVASDCSWLWGELNAVFCCYSPSSSRFSICILRSFSVHHTWLFELPQAFLSAWASLAILLWPLSSIRHF